MATDGQNDQGGSPNPAVQKVAAEITATETAIEQTAEKIETATPAQEKTLDAHMTELHAKLDGLLSRLEALEGKAAEPVVNAPKPVDPPTASQGAATDAPGASGTPAVETPSKPARRRLGAWGSTTVDE